jgi:hypothetical protein
MMVIRRRDPDPAALREFRERRGWTYAQMADEVGGSPLEVAAWEAGTVRVPREQARHIRALAVDDARRAAVIEAALPSCAWPDARAPGLQEMLCIEPRCLDGNLLAQRHVGECATCRRLYEFSRALETPTIDPRLGSEPVDVRRPVLSVLACIAATVLLRWLGWDGHVDNDWYLPLMFGVGAFGATARVLGPFSRHYPSVAGLITATMGVLSALLFWPLNHEVTPVTLAVSAVLILVMARLAGWWNESGYAADGDADAEFAGAAGAAVPLLAQPLPADIDPPRGPAPAEPVASTAQHAPGATTHR